MASRDVVSLVLVFAAAANAGAGSGDWPCYGHTASRHSIAVDGPNTVDANNLKWVADADPQDPNYYVKFEGPTGPVVYNGKIYAYAKYYNESQQYTNSQIVAYDANSGQTLWATAIDHAVYGSWSTPCVDTKHNTVLIGSGDKVFALDAQSGEQRWATQLGDSVVNASVCAAVDISCARAFITDISKLYCINLDPKESANPYEPGQIVWSAAIGMTWGNTPAYKDGVVYVASANTPGTIYAYDATAEPNAIKLWEATDTSFGSFFGGVTVTKEGFLYAASYNFSSGEDNASLCKIDCNGGSIVWITQTERTDSIPVVAGNKIYISGGADYTGTRPKVEAYRDDGNSVTKLWETPSSMTVGGWANQPVYANGKLYVGNTLSLGENYYSSTKLYILDVSVTPNDPNFIVAHYDANNCGNSPAVTYDSIYTIGNYIDRGGLFKFHQPALLSDISKDGKTDTHDLNELANMWLYNGAIGVKRSDLDLDGDVDFEDFCILADEWGKELD